MIARFLAPALVAFSISSAHAEQSYSIIGMDGTPVMNHVVPVTTGDEVKRLPAAVTVGNPKGDVTVYEFYDLNCPYCRKAATDLRAMLAADKQLNLVLVPFPVLGIPSIQAGRVEFAVARLASPAKFAQFHQKIFSGRGTVDGARALAVAEDLGIARDKILALADTDPITDAMKAHVRLGDTLKMLATPSLVVQDAVIVGYPGRTAMEKIVRAVRQCGKAEC